MKKINLTITGCLGRMGQQLVKSSKTAKNFKLVSVTENREIDKKVSGLKPQLNTEVPVSLNREQKELLEKFREIENENQTQVAKNSFKKPKVFGRIK